MAIAETDIPLIKPWLIKRSGELSDAEPEVLADYIIALLNNQVTGGELIKLVASQIEDFVDGSEKFAVEIEESLRTRSFDTKNEQFKKKLLDPEETKKRTQKAAIELSNQFFKPDTTTYRVTSKKKSQRFPFNDPSSLENINNNNYHQIEKQKQNNTFNNIITHHQVHEGTKLIVSNLPHDRLQEPIIRAYFQRFGELKNVSIDHIGRFAELEFEKAKDAKKAWISPIPIFENRFIKVFYEKEQKTEERKEEELFDVEKFKTEQIDKQKKWEAKQEQKKQYCTKLQNMIELKEKMLSNFEKELTQLEEQLKANPSLESKVSQKVETIQKQMEADGVIPELIAQDRAKLEGKPIHAIHGALRDRSRGVLRGRGVLRSRGALRGRGGRGVHVGFPYTKPQNKLDLRTRAILIKNFGDVEDIKFKQLLLNIGEGKLQEVTKLGDHEIRLVFKERYVAEFFFRDETKLTEDGKVFIKEWDESIRPEIINTGRNIFSETNTLAITVDQNNDIEM